MEKENGNHYIDILELYRGYIGVMDKKWKLL